MRYLFLILMVAVMFSCEKVIDCGFGAVSIRVINESDIDFDTIRFEVSIAYEQTVELIFTDVKTGQSSDYYYLHQLDVMYYEDESEYVYFTNYLYGVAEDQNLFETGFGFCGTGLTFDTTNSGKFKAVITGIDLENKHMFIQQMREE